MNKNFRFYVINLIVQLACQLAGFFISAGAIMDWFINRYNLRAYKLGAEAYSVGFFGLVGGLVGLVIGIFVSLIFSHRLGRRFGQDLSFGAHPVLKLTVLSLLTSFLILLGLLFFLPKEY